MKSSCIILFVCSSTLSARNVTDVGVFEEARLWANQMCKRDRDVYGMSRSVWGDFNGLFFYIVVWHLSVVKFDSQGPVVETIGKLNREAKQFKQIQASRRCASMHVIGQLLDNQPVKINLRSLQLREYTVNKDDINITVSHQSSRKQDEIFSIQQFRWVLN